MTRRRDLAATDLEDLLDGRPSVVDPALAAVLAAARAPGTAAELAGLHAAVDAFGTRSPWTAPARAPGPWSGLVAVVSGWPVRLLAALAASTAVAGVSLAAVTGTLPGGLSVPSVTTPSSPSGIPAGPTTGTDGSSAGAGLTPTDAVTGSAAAAAPSADPGSPAGGGGAAGSVPSAEPSARPTVPPGTAGRPADPAAGTAGPTRPPEARVPSTTVAAAPSTVPPAVRTTGSPAATPTTPSHPTGR